MHTNLSLVSCHFCENVHQSQIARTAREGGVGLMNTLLRAAYSIKIN